MHSNQLPGHSSSPTQQQVAILVVDEVQENLEKLEVVLKESGYRPLTVRNSVEAIARLRAGAHSFHSAVPPETLPPPFVAAAGQDGTPEAQYRILFENTGTPLVILDGAGSRVLELNAAASALLGYTIGELLPSSSVPFVKGGRFHFDFSPGRNSVRSEMTLVNKTGARVEVEITAVFLEGTGESRMVLSLRDLTQERWISSRLQQVDKMSMMGNLASGIAHEIRNPLAAVMLNLQCLELSSTAHAGNRDTIAAALEGVNRIEQVVQNTLHLARSTPSATRRENIGDLIDRTIWFLKIPLEQRSIRIRVESGEALPDVEADGKAIQQVLLNLLQNAVEASAEGAEVVVRTSLSTTPAGERFLLVDVIDSGAGIPNDILQHLFEPFRTSKAAGTGLGLTISRQIMERHGGCISVPATGPGGTTVRLAFPIHHHPPGEVYA